MKIGVCGVTSLWPSISSRGFDYAEGNLSQIATMSDDEFGRAKQLAGSLGLTVPTYNGFFPGTYSLYDTPTESLLDYTRTALTRAEYLGGKIAVLGSGRARSVPEGMSPSDAADRFAGYLYGAGEIASEHGMMIAIEPLRAVECNFINTLKDAVDICRAVNHPSVRAMVDCFHFTQNGEDLADIETYAPYITHIHVAAPSRQTPKASDIPALLPFFKKLADIGYLPEGRLSLECAWAKDFGSDIADAKQVVSELVKRSIIKE